MVSFIFVKVSTVVGQITVHGRNARKLARIKALAMSPERLETGPAQIHLPLTEVMTASELKLTTKFAISISLVVSNILFGLKYSIRTISYSFKRIIACLIFYTFHYNIQIGTARGTIGVRGDIAPQRVMLALWKDIVPKTLSNLLQEHAPDNQHKPNLAS